MPDDFLHNLPNTEEGENEPSRIEQMEQKLYSRTQEIKQKERTQLHPKRFANTEDWEGNEESLRFEKKEKPHHVSLYTVIFFVSFTFFVVAGVLAAFTLLNKKQAISPNNVSLSVFGPVSVSGGDVLSIQVLIENKNTVPLQDADILVQFPDGTHYVNQTDKTQDRFHKTLGTIAPGEIRAETVKAVIFGEEKDIKEMAVTSSYRMEGSDAKFTKSTGYKVMMTVPALTVKTNLLSEATSGQEITLSFDIESRSPSSLKNALLQIDYPQGFDFTSATPPPSFSNNTWKLGNMAFGDKQQVEIKGIINGEDAQEKVFRTYTGIAKNDTSSVISTVFSSLLPGLTIKKPFLGVEVAINGSTDQAFVFDKRPNADVDILWANNLPDKIIDGQIEVSVKGSAINRNTILPRDGGFYRSSDDVIFWDKRTSESLGTIPAGGRSSVGFSFALLPLASGSSVFHNPEIEIGVSVKGKRVSESNVPEEIDSFVTKKFKVATTLQFAARSVHYTGPFQNTGPLPPKVQKETTYTIIWVIQNTANDISGATVKAVLPPYVAWKNLVAPNGANLTYNPVSHEIIWNLGKIKAGTGYETEPQEVSFQVGLTPGLAQVGKNPALISEAIFSGKDDFAGVEIDHTVNPLTTMLSTDPQFDVKQSMVVK